MSKLHNWKESLLSQPPSFSKKKAYETHQVLGTGTFGKVVVIIVLLLIIIIVVVVVVSRFPSVRALIINNFSAQLGVFLHT
jgi:hypothetical protein